jgi:putative DNA primase/helicase
MNSRRTGSPSDASAVTEPNGPRLVELGPGLSIPFELDISHRDEFHYSGIRDAMIEAAGIFSAQDRAIRIILRHQPKNFSWGRGFVIPYRFPNEPSTTYQRVKLDFPRHDRKGEPIKYESPVGTPNRAYFPPRFFGTCASAPYIFITAGEKKALAGMQMCIPTIGLVGVWGWQKARKRDEVGRAFGKRELIPDLAGINWKGREVIIVFDSDSASNRNVLLAEARLGDALKNAGATVRAARIPPSEDGGKVGLDDFLVAHRETDAEALLSLIETAKEPRVPRQDSPVAWARWLLDDEFVTADGVLTLRWWRDEFYVYRQNRYVKVPESELAARTLLWLDRNHAEAKPRLASGVVKGLGSLSVVPFHVDQPCFVDGEVTEQADINPANIIAFQNGLLQIPEPGGQMRIHAHAPSWFSTVVLNYDFAPEAMCPGWENFLNTSLVDPELIDLLQRYFGLLLTTDTSYQKLLLMVGPSGAGKGTICRTIQRVIGEDACTSPVLTSLASEFGLWPLCDKTVAILADAHLGHHVDSTRVLETIKAITGEDALNVNRKNMPFLQNVRLKVRFVITVNELPHFSDLSGALAARLLVLPFFRSFREREDRMLEQRLSAESAGILNWALRGLRRLKAAGGFNRPAASEEILSNYRRLTSPVSAFVEDACEVEPGKRVRIDKIYAAYRQWAHDNGHNIAAKAKFCEQLRLVQPGLAKRRYRDRASAADRSDQKRPYVYEGIDLTDVGHRLAEEGLRVGKESA